MPWGRSVGVAKECWAEWPLEHGPRLHHLCGVVASPERLTAKALATDAMWCAEVAEVAGLTGRGVVAAMRATHFAVDPGGCVRPSKCVERVFALWLAMFSTLHGRSGAKAAGMR